MIKLSSPVFFDVCELIPVVFYSCTIASIFIRWRKIRGLFYVVHSKCEDNDLALD